MAPGWTLARPLNIIQVMSMKAIVVSSGLPAIMQMGHEQLRQGCLMLLFQLLQLFAPDSELLL